jgi:23S rRNA maturation-related 3'-5' exoribonuclease YhaM
MWYAGKNASIRVDNNLIQRTPVIVAYERTPILSVVINDQTGYIGVDWTMYDTERNHIATIKHNQIYLVKGQKIITRSMVTQTGSY